MSPHKPVLLQEVLNAFSDVEGIFVDCTLGYAGHSCALLEQNPKLRLIGIDQDKEAIAFSTNRLTPFKERVEILKGRYAERINDALASHPKAILADIGVSSLQLDKIDRGFSFQSDTLDMRMDSEQDFSAFNVVNEYSANELERIFKAYAELHNPTKVVQAITQARAKEPIRSAKELAHIIEKVLPKRKKIHPATLIFQAIRIEVNDELGELERLLDAIEEAKPKGARVAIITFHSLEDRVVKNRFRQWAKACICPATNMRCECGGHNALGKVLTKKPLIATQEELQSNPRSRSAKLRIFEMK